MQASTLMMAAYKDFKDLSEKFANERSISPNDNQAETRMASGYSWDDYTNEELSEDEYTPGDDETVDAEDEAENEIEYQCEDFPGRSYFSFKDIDVNDPAFYSGKHLGLPFNEAVHRASRQNNLLPMNGLGDEL